MRFYANHERVRIITELLLDYFLARARAVANATHSQRSYSLEIIGFFAAKNSMKTRR